MSNHDMIPSRKRIIIQTNIAAVLFALFMLPLLWRFESGVLIFLQVMSALTGFVLLFVLVLTLSHSIERN